VGESPWGKMSFPGNGRSTGECQAKSDRLKKGGTEKGDQQRLSSWGENTKSIKTLIET